MKKLIFTSVLALFVGAFASAQTTAAQPANSPTITKTEEKGNAAKATKKERKANKKKNAAESVNISLPVPDAAVSADAQPAKKEQQ